MGAEIREEMIREEIREPIHEKIRKIREFAIMQGK